MFTLEKIKYEEFCKRFKLGEFGNQRFGQAFYNEFHLDKSTQGKEIFNTLWNMDGEDAKEFIHAHFEFS